MDHSEITPSPDSYRLAHFQVGGKLFDRKYMFRLFEAAKRPGWTPLVEIRNASKMDSAHRAMLLGFLANAEFSADPVGFAPFTKVGQLPTETTMISSFRQLVSDALPTSLKLTSTIRGFEYTIYVNAPSCVVQHAELDTSTWELIYTFADVYVAGASRPTRHDGLFIPTEHLQRRTWPRP